MTEKMYSCIYCGAKTSTLVKRFNSSVLKLTKCEECRSTADKYVECDNTVVLIDLILFKKEPYRHIIFNSEFKNYWKIALILFVVLTYEQWVSLNRARTMGTSLKSREKALYSTLAITAAGCVTYLFLVINSIVFTQWVLDKTKPSKETVGRLSKVLTLSSFGLFLLLPSLIWTHEHRDAHLLVVAFYTVVSQIQALQVVTSLSRVALGTIMVSSLWVKVWAQNEVRQFFVPFEEV